MIYQSGCTKKRWLLIIVSLMVSVIFSVQIISCRQYSIFAAISDEVPPKKPMIPGSLTEIVIAKEDGGENTYLYVAGISSKRIYKYNEGTWTYMDAPGGRIIALASDGEGIYALSGNDVMNAGLYKKNGSLDWTEITTDSGDAAGYSLQSIYCADDTLFVGGRKGEDYAIFYLNGDTLMNISSGNSAFTGEAELKGAVNSSGTFYIAAGNNGIFSWNSGMLTGPVAGSEDQNVTGIKDISGNIVAVTWGGSVLRLEGGNFVEKETGGPSFTGGIAVLQKFDGASWKDSFVLLGVHSTGRFNKGYRELILDNGNINFTLQIPGSSDNSSVSLADKNKFDASIARSSVYSIMQVPREVEDYTATGMEPVIFAATVNGLQRLRDGEWNAED